MFVNDDRNKESQLRVVTKIKSKLNNDAYVTTTSPCEDSRVTMDFNQQVDI